MKRYDVFTRTWWKEAERHGWPGNLEPCPGERTYLARDVTFTVARAMCKDWNARHDPGRYSLKAEFESA